MIFFFEYFLEHISSELGVEAAEGGLRFRIEIFLKEVEECAISAGGWGIVIDGAVREEKGGVESVRCQGLGDFVNEVAGSARCVKVVGILRDSEVFVSVAGIILDGDMERCSA